MNHRRTPAPGYRPLTAARAARFAVGRCVRRGCPSWYVLDRQVSPWSRARTCTDSCRAQLGNQGRTGATCEHCAVVESWRELVAAEVPALDVAGRDEAIRPTTYREFLTGYRYSNGDLVAEDLAA